MTEQFNSSAESSNFVSAQLEALGACVDQLAQTLQLTRQQVRSYAKSVVQNFSSGSGDDFLLVDRVLRLIKRMLHHARNIYQSLTNNASFLDHHDLIRVSQYIKDTMEALMKQYRYLQQTFGWLIEQLLIVVHQTMQKAHV